MADSRSVHERLDELEEKVEKLLNPTEDEAEDNDSDKEGE